jgi:hypothetical protein
MIERGTESEMKDALGVPAMHALGLLDVYGFAVMVRRPFNEAVGERAEFAWRLIAERQRVR